MSAFDVALQPNATPYSSPLKLYEYMALGRAIVAPDQGNIREVLTNDENGLLFRPDDDQAFRAAVERLCEILRIPSVGTDPAHDADTRRAARWFADQLAGLGFDASVRDTPGQPMVVAHLDPPGATGPHLLYYGHYDVQPPDPLDLWETAPFEPFVRDGRFVGRGVADDKGQLVMHLGAIEALRAAHRQLGVNLTFVFEGEEEFGSDSLYAWIDANRDVD